MMEQFFEPFYTFFLENGYSLELVLAVSAFAWWMPRRHFFALRLAGLTGGLMLLSILSGGWGLSGVWMLCLESVLFVLLCIPGVQLCYEADWNQALFSVTAASAAQHLSFKAGQTLASLVQLQWEKNLFTSVWLYPLGFGTALCLCWLLFARRLGRARLPHSSRTLLPLLLCGQLTTNLMQNLLILAPDQMESGLYYLFQLYGMLVCLFILCLQYEIGAKQAAQQDNALLGQLIYQQKQQLAVRREVIGVINAKCHELKQQTAALRGLVPPEQLDAINQAVSAYDAVVNTGSEPLNVLLSEKRLLCQGKQIAFDCLADGRTLGFLRTSDLYALLGTILDNAVGAAQQVQDPAGRFIRLEIARQRDMVVIHCENTCLPSAAPQPEQEGHRGFGLRTIRSIARQYGGCCQVRTEEGRFVLNLLFPGQGAVQGGKTTV